MLDMFKLDQLFMKGRFPRWRILLIDMFICTFTIYIAYQLRFNFDIPKDKIQGIVYAIPALLLIRLILFLIFKTFSGIIFYTSTEDALRIFFTVTTGSVLLLVINMICFTISEFYFVPHSVIIIDYVFSMFFHLIQFPLKL